MTSGLAAVIAKVEAAARAAWPHVDRVALTTMARGLAAIPEALGAGEVPQ